MIFWEYLYTVHCRNLNQSPQNVPSFKERIPREKNCPKKTPKKQSKIKSHSKKKSESYYRHNKTMTATHTDM
jgi:hypothetical protein